MESGDATGGDGGSSMLLEVSWQFTATGGRWQFNAAGGDGGSSLLLEVMVAVHCNSATGDDGGSSLLLEMMVAVHCYWR